MSNWKSRILRNILISLGISNILILIGKDNWLLLFTNPLHYLDMGVTFLSVFLIFEYVDWINRRLNKQYLLTHKFLNRILLQIAFGLLVPAALAIAFTYIMWSFLWGKTLLEGNYFKYEFLPQTLIILVVNLFFVISDLVKKTPVIIPKITLMAQKGIKKVPVSLEDISFIQLKDRVVHLTTDNGENLLLSDNLDTIENLLPPDDFFRANRQIILSKRNCKSFKSASNGKLEVELLSKSEAIIVSQKRAASFRSWIRI